MPLTWKKPDLKPLPKPQMHPVNTYGCVKCQRTHFEDTEFDLFQQHIYWQSKHGAQLLHETLEERARRYSIRYGL